jgi:hypothetical protein
MLQGAQMFAILLGGVLAGGGQRNGLVLGAVVGVWNGVLSVLFKQNPGTGITTVSLYGMPILQAAFGAVGGWVGSLIWRPIRTESTTVRVVPARKAPRPRRRSPLAGPIAWVRVLLGAILAVGGTLSAALIFQKVLDVSGGRLSTTHELQDWLITWEIKALAVLLGGALAGATTPNGLKQGLAVGIGASVVLVGLQARITYLPFDVWLKLTALTAVSSFALAVAGGWFGGQLFPPVIRVPRGSRFGPQAFH